MAKPYYLIIERKNLFPAPHTTGRRLGPVKRSCRTIDAADYEQIRRFDYREDSIVPDQVITTAVSNYNTH